MLFKIPSTELFIYIAVSPIQLGLCLPVSNSQKLEIIRSDQIRDWNMSLNQCWSREHIFVTQFKGKTTGLITSTSLMLNMRTVCRYKLTRTQCFYKLNHTYKYISSSSHTWLLDSTAIHKKRTTVTLGPDLFCSSQLSNGTFST